VSSVLALRSSAPLVDFDSLAQAQRGLVTRQQILACGLTDGNVRSRLHARQWQRVLRGVYATFTGSLTLEQRRLAAYLFAGPDAQITGVAALRWHGLRYLPDDDRIHLLIPLEEQRASAGFARLQRTRDLDARARAVNGYAICSVARAVADACRGLDDLGTVRAIVAESIQRNLTSVSALVRELVRAGRHRTRLLRLAITEVAHGSASALEGAVQEALSRSTILPAILWNPQLESREGQRLPSPDGWIPDVAIALEIDSRQYHLGPAGWELTLSRHNLLAAAGVLVLHFTPSDVRHAKRVVRTVEMAYRERVRSGATAEVRTRHDGSRQ
jgi:hypothetical protein